MDKKSIKICDWIIKYSIYALVFLVPVFFLPWTSEILDFNKQALLLLLAIVGIFAWMLKCMASGHLEIRKTPLHYAVGAFFAVYILSTIFSVFKYGSFWGWPQVTSESLLSFLGFFIVYFLASNTFSQKNVFEVAGILMASAVVAQIAGILQIFGVIGFNTMGTLGSLGIFSAILLPLAIIMAVLVKKWWKILFGVEIALSAAVFVLVNFALVWWVVAAGAILLLVFGVMKRDLMDGRWLALPMFFLAVSIFFLILNPQMAFLAQKPSEVFLSQAGTWKISWQEIKERPILGSGPGTFVYDFSKFKDESLSKTILWNAVFTKGGTKILNDLATTGVLGFLALLALLLAPAFYGCKYLILQRKEAGLLMMGICMALVLQILAYFLYSGSFVLEFLFFIVISAISAMLWQETKEWEFKPSSLATLVATFAFTLLFIFGLGLLILDGQRYAAEVYYYSGLSSLQANNLDAGQKQMETAASLNSASDLYFRQLSQVYLLQLQKATDKQKAQTLLTNAVNSGKITTDINSKSATNWAMRGYIYQNLVAVSADAADWAKKSYDEALKLSPNDPYLYAQKGTLFLSQALKSTGDAKDQLLGQAKTSLEKAVSLNPNYANALFSLGVAYDALGQTDKAVEALKQVQQMNPDNKQVQQALANAYAGVPVLKQAVPKAETPPSPAAPTPNKTTK